ncbi:uncharacterized protein LOC121681677 isoform X1 [Alosa sapidissima]|uniref:uncharacterized protein LOC121681677 isoform X1 n=2 Tax=Alosa sapidissima TaxID=34773 RepID=UPI001C09B655|nr:uncharacterized protein LOC121681677 isoform X1 [Alosa sapidissima]
MSPPLSGYLQMMYGLLSVLGVLLGIAPGVDCRTEVKQVCPGSPFYFKLEDSLKSQHINLYFVQNWSERKIATGTQSLDPQYPFKDNEPYIPEVMKKHEGEYYWAVRNVRLKLNHIRLIVKDCSSHKDLDYGDEIKLDVPSDASVLEFDPHLSDKRLVLWSRINAKNEKGARGTVALGYWRAQRMTQADQGRYVFLRESGGHITDTVVTVQAKTKHAHVADEDIKDIWQTFVDIPRHEVVITYFTPHGEEYTLFQNDVETDKAFSLFRGRLTLTTGWFSILKVQPRDAGRYEIRDKNGHLAMSMYLKRDPEFDWKSLIMPLGISAGVMAGLLCCCWCCCKVCSDSDDSDKAESTAVSPDTEPPVHFHDPITLSGPDDPLQPPSSSSGNPPNPWESSPPPYSTVAQYELYVPDIAPSPVAPVAPTEAPDEGEGAGGGAGGGARGGGGGDGVAHTAPSAPLDPGLQYQPRAWGNGLDDFLSNAPLFSDSTAADSSTYISAKLNF